MKVNVTAMSEAMAAIIQAAEGRDVEPWELAAQATGFLCGMSGVSVDDVLPVIEAATKAGGATDGRD